MESLAVILSGTGALLLLLISLGIGAVLHGNRRANEKLGGVAEALAAISATITAVVLRVDELSRWKEDVQRREADELRAEIADLKQGRGRRVGDT